MGVTLRVSGLCQENGKALVEPVVPTAAIDAIVRTSFAAEPSFGPAAARARLLHHYEELRELALAGVAAGHSKAQDAVRLALDTAAAGSEAGRTGDVEEVVSPTGTHSACPQPLGIVRQSFPGVALTMDCCIRCNDSTPASAAEHLSPGPSPVV